MKQAVPRKKCTECRRWYAPSARVGERQRTCGEACRLRRRRRLARRRRSQDEQSARVAERERQRWWRAGRRARGPDESGAKGPAPTACHAPTSDAISAELQQKMRESVDRAFDLSRAAILRCLPKILGNFAQFETKRGTESGP